MTGPGPEQERSYRQARLVAVRAWAFVGCAVALAIALRVLGMVGSALECLLVAVIVGYICASITNRLERLGVGRALGALLALVVVMGVASGVLFWLGPLFVDQLSQLLGRVPGYLGELQGTAQDLWARYGQGGSTQLATNLMDVIQGLSAVGTRMATDLATSLSSNVFPYVMSFANGMVMFFLGIVMAYWFAKDYPVIFREMGVIAGPRHADDLALLLTVLGRSMGGYMSGVIVTSLVNGVLVFLGLLAVGNPYAGLMAILTGILHVIPVVGPMASAAFATVVALFTSPVMALWSLVVCVVAQNVTDNLVSPLVMRSAVSIHPAMSLLGITIGASLGGALGMALAIPLTAAAKGVFVYYFESRTGRQLVSFDGAFFQGTPFRREDGSPAPSVDAIGDERLPSTARLMDEASLRGVSACERPAAAPGGLARLLGRMRRGH